MKKLILSIVVLAFVSLSISAQKSKNVPENIKKAFNQKFAKATDVKWGMENKTEWEAEFKLDGKEISANYDLQGKWLETEYKITIEEIPTIIKSSIEKNNAGCKIKSADVSETPKAKVYEVMILKGKKSVEVIMDEKGKVVKE